MPTSTPKILPIADRLTGQTRKTFLQAIRKLQRSASAKDILKAIETGNLGAVQSAIKYSKLAKDLGPTISTMNAALIAAGRVTLLDIGIKVRFDIKNRFAEKAAIDHRARLVRDVSSATQRAISHVVNKGLVEGIAPRELAKLIKPMIGLTSNQASSALTLRKTMLMSGASPATTSKVVGRWIEKKLKERAVTIARTEIIRASNAGQHAAWNDAIDKQLIRVGGEPREWLAADSERTCPICVGLDGEIVPFDQPFSTGAMYPPTHPRCRCSVGLVYENVS
jgi:SPP1 gp7 family putative phage head morphogenesis protein